jgi:hypothetical protein
MPVTSIARPTDTPLARLTAPELFLITSTRLWVAPYRHPSVALPDWQEGFASAQLDQGATASFDTLIRIVAASSRSALDIRWHCCPHLGEAESCLLLCLALWQRKRFNESLAFVANWLSPPAARVAIDPGEKLAVSLLKAGLIVPFGGPENHNPGSQDVVETLERGSRLIH